MFKRIRFDISFLYSVLFLLICWILFISEEYLGYHFTNWGLRPREPIGLVGIGSMHFLHGGWSHLVNNSLSFIVLNTMLFYYYKEISTKVFWYIFLLGAILLWIIGRDSNHIGASLIIFGEAAFLFFSGVIRDFPKLLRISLFVAFFYGSMVWYIFPVDQHISWEGHLSGALIGLIAAVLFRKQGPKRDKYDFEIEQEQIDAYKLLSDEEIIVVDVQEYVNQRPRTNVQFDYRPKEEG